MPSSFSPSDLAPESGASDPPDDARVDVHVPTEGPLSPEQAVEAYRRALGSGDDWYDALLELERSGAKGLRPFELQKQLLFAQYNLSRLGDRLDAAGYVVRKASAADGRGQVLTITASGRALRRRMWPVYAQAIEDAVGHSWIAGYDVVLLLPQFLPRDQRLHAAIVCGKHDVAARRGVALQPAQPPLEGRVRGVVDRKSVV